MFVLSSALSSCCSWVVADGCAAAGVAATSVTVGAVEERVPPMVEL